jgi:UDP-N-acetyl-D-galactosamine dehydrogenase
VLVLGLAFKENVPDLRSSQVPDLCRELEKQGISVYAYDPLAEVGDCLAGTGVCVVDAPETAAPVDAIIVAVRHSAFLDLGMEYFRSLSSDRPVLIDVKGCYSAEEAEEQGIAYWRL